jgi:DNA-binding response OmpR family regulator
MRSFRGTPSGSDRARILAVDDNASVREILSSVLTAASYEVRTASNGYTALQTVHEWSPDLIITDLSMHPIDGFRLCQELRKISKVPVIVLSGETAPDVRECILSSGANYFIQKPPRLDELLMGIATALNGAHRATDHAIPSTFMPI